MDRRRSRALENAPYDWSSTTKATYSAREQPLQALQAEKIKEQAEDFGLKVADFRASLPRRRPSSTRSTRC